MLSQLLSLVKQKLRGNRFARSLAERKNLYAENKKRRHPGELKANPRHGLHDTQIYQTGVNYFAALEKATTEKFNTLRTNADTVMASIGTCFAEEFSSFMKASNGQMGKYLYVEQNVFNSSANWGRVYTIQNLLQIVRYSLTDDIPVYIEECERGFFDPLREYSVGYKKTREEAYASTVEHRRLSREVFTTTQVMVITLGQNEGWLELDTNYIWGIIPPADIMAKKPERFKPVESGYQKNITDLQMVIDMLLSANNNLKIILTVSPVAAAATFIDSDVITQSFAGKCVLRSVVKEIITANKGKVFYFPSFEMVLGYNPTSFLSDNRHVVRPKVNEIFSSLGRILKNNWLNH